MTTDQTRFHIIFKKLEELGSARQDSILIPEQGPTTSELDEISEVRRLAMTIADPEPNSYTTT
jgi:hypothetical protein